MDSLFGFLFVIAITLIFIASQLFWVRRLRKMLARLVPGSRSSKALDAALVSLYVLLLFANLPWINRSSGTTELTLWAALLEAPFRWWLLGSMLGFAMLIVFDIVDRLRDAAVWAWRKVTAARRGQRSDPLPNASRRRFLEQTALGVSAAPFVAGAYGLLYGRLNLETTRQRIVLQRLAKAFNGFRIAQLSDLHIGPFMSGEEIRKYVAIANSLKPDLFVLTGDFVTWDSETQEAVVEALTGLKAPFGVFGCLGNHELWTETQASITRLFAGRGIHILRRARAPIELHGERLNVIGVDFQTRRHMGPHGEDLVGAYLAGVKPLVVPDTVNILLSHNPNTFDRAAEMGIDLSLAGHTHGGQVSLEFVHRGLAPSRLITSYVSGWFEKPGGQLYVNRGIGTIGVPIRFGSRPEITVFELTRKG